MFDNAFYVKTWAYSLIFFANSSDERDILFHEINALSETKNAYVMHTSARESTMDNIDAIDSFNAYNLSMSCAPNFESDHIIAADKRSAIYIRDGYRCYTSKTMHKEPYLTDGCVFKAPEKKIHLQEAYLRQYLAIDFKLK